MDPVWAIENQDGRTSGSSTNRFKKKKKKNSIQALRLEEIWCTLTVVTLAHLFSSFSA